MKLLKPEKQKKFEPMFWQMEILLITSPEVAISIQKQIKMVQNQLERAFIIWFVSRYSKNPITRFTEYLWKNYW
jgi:hypothetical protein